MAQPSVAILQHGNGTITRNAVAPGKGRPRSASLAGTNLDALSARSPEINAALQRFVDVVGYVVTSGYCVGEQYALEQPEMLVKTIAGALDSPAASNRFTPTTTCSSRSIRRASSAAFLTAS